MSLQGSEHTLSQAGQDLLNEFYISRFIPRLNGLPKEDRAILADQVCCSLFDHRSVASKGSRGSNSSSKSKGGKKGKKKGPEAKPWTQASRILDSFPLQKEAKKAYVKALKAYKCTKFEDLPDSVSNADLSRIRSLRSQWLDALDIWKTECAATDGCFDPEKGPPVKKAREQSRSDSPTPDVTSIVTSAENSKPTESILPKSLSSKNA